MVDKKEAVEAENANGEQPEQTSNEPMEQEVSILAHVNFVKEFQQKCQNLI